MGAIVQGEVNKLLDALNGVTTFSAVTTPLKLRLMTANGSATSAGTEVTGGSYASQTITFGAASAGSAANNGSTINYNSMPAVTVVGVEIWDTTGTPRRLWWGALTSSKTLASGDNFQVAVGAIVASLS
jgi:hypothetical protein